MTDLQLIGILATMCIICFLLGGFIAMICIGGKRQDLERTNFSLLQACESAYNYLNDSPMLTDDEEFLYGTLEITIQEAKESNL